MDRLVRRCALTLGVSGAALLLTAFAWAAAATAKPVKAGIASSKYLASAPKRLNVLGASWSYDWSSKLPPADPQLDWVPMIWGSASITPAVIASLQHDRKDGRARYLLGFNEPDATAQSNMTPTQAAALWPQLEKTGLTLGSPAVATPTDGWLAQFMKLVRRRHLRVDFIALHYYQDFTDPDAVAQLRSQLVALHKQYHLPIWITEIGAVDIRSWGEHMDHAPTAAGAATYMRKLFRMLNGLPFVQRYAWFTDQCGGDVVCQTGQLFGAGGQLTVTGQAFKQAA